MLKLAPILKEISKDFRMGGHDGKLHQAFTLVMEWEAVEYLKVSRWDQKSQITTVEFVIRAMLAVHRHKTVGIATQDVFQPAALDMHGDRHANNNVSPVYPLLQR